MTAMELDPLFVKALGFLRSKTKESADQLRELLDDVISGSGKSKTDRPLSSFGGLKSAEDRSLAKTKRGGRSSPLSKSEKARKDAEKRTADRAKLEPSDSDSAPTKKSKVERPQRQAAKPVVEDDDDTDEDSDDSNHDSGNEDAPETTTGGSTDADDFALELGLACVVCKKMDVSAGNNLIECQECHNLYHQQCHKPAATDADPNDPRLVWYCARCARNMKRQASKKPKSLPSSGRGDSKVSDETAMNLFKRSEPKTVSPSGTSKQPFTGLASMAANLSGRPSSSNNKASKTTTAPAAISSRSSSRASASSPVSKSAPSSAKQYSSSSSSSSKSSSSKGSTSGKAMSQTSTASAMKRLHMMKKKASKR